jgi:hypothetical protein
MASKLSAHTNIFVDISHAIKDPHIKFLMLSKRENYVNKLRKVQKGNLKGTI